MRKLFPLLTLTLLAACTPAATDTSRVMAGKGILIRVEKSVTEDAQATQHTKAILHVSGVATKDIDLGDVLGELVYVDPATYETYAEQENKPETLAVFTAWWAGQGEEIQVQLHNQNLIVTHQYGDEEGTCTKWEELARVPLGQDVAVEWENLGEPGVDHSSIDFCNQK